MVAAREAIVALYDERFFRMWQFYLAGAVAAFRHDGHVVFQLQLARRRDAVPLTRDYLAEAEARLRGADSGAGDIGVEAGEMSDDRFLIKE